MKKNDLTNRKCRETDESCFPAYLLYKLLGVVHQDKIGFCGGVHIQHGKALNSQRGDSVLIGEGKAAQCDVAIPTFLSHIRGVHNGAAAVFYKDQTVFKQVDVGIGSAPVGIFEIAFAVGFRQGGQHSVVGILGVLESDSAQSGFIGVLHYQIELVKDADRGGAVSLQRIVVVTVFHKQVFTGLFVGAVDALDFGRCLFLGKTLFQIKGLQGYVFGATAATGQNAHQQSRDQNGNYKHFSVFHNSCSTLSVFC